MGGVILTDGVEFLSVAGREVAAGSYGIQGELESPVCGALVTRRLGPDLICNHDDKSAYTPQTRVTILSTIIIQTHTHTHTHKACRQTSIHCQLKEVQVICWSDDG